MRLRIRSKLIVVISGFILVLFGLMAYLLVGEKRNQLAEDIYLNSLAFGRLTAGDVVESYDLYLAENSFVYFNRDVRALLSQSADIAGVELVSFDGQLVYSSFEDQAQRYAGAPRMIGEEQRKLLYTEDVAILAEDGESYFLSAESFDPHLLMRYFAVPATERYTVFYYLDYANLEALVAATAWRIVYLALFGILLGVFVSIVMARRVTRPVQDLVVGAEKIAIGDFKTRVDIQTNDELQSLGESFNKMAVDLEASIEAKVYNERVMHELELATEIQKTLVPKVIPQVKGLDLAAGLIPAEEIGGDIYDFIKVSEERLVMYLGDVTGHGVPAGIVSSVANALFFGFAHQSDLREILVRVNTVMQAKIMATMFMTLCLMEWDAAGEVFRYASAGHEQVMHYKAATGEVELKPAGGVALAMVANIAPHIKVDEIKLEPGDFLVIYSDGIPEMWRNEKEVYGMERFMAAVKSFGDLGSALAIKEAILADVEQFSAGYKQMDDVTLIVVKKV